MIEDEIEQSQSLAGSSKNTGFAGEEDIEGQSTPAKDLGSACVIAVLAITVAVMSVRLDVPGSVYTAPGLLPFMTSLSLFLMAIFLGLRAMRAGGAAHFVGGAWRAITRYIADYQGRRSLLLIVIVVIYVILVGSISFDLRMPTPLFVFRLSSYEVISIGVITLIMKLYWKAPLARCFFVSLISIEVLASIYRYGFAIIMPESF